MEAVAAPAAHRLPTSARLLSFAGDDRLVALIREGSQAAFEVVYERYHRRLLSFCRHLLGNPEDAADAVQHTFISAHRDLVSTQKPIQLRAWLFTIARNRSLSLLRVRREHADVDAIQPATDGLTAEVERREDLRELLGDLAHLPDDQRAALVLAEIGSLTHDEIAQIIDCPPTKVKALVFQARSSLSASREARDIPCREVREQLASQRGSALRHGSLRRHVRECTGCRDFRDEVRRQRQAFAQILPVAPVVGLKEAVLSGVGISTGGGAAAAGSGASVAIAALGAQSLAVKALVTAGIIGGVAAGGVAITSGLGNTSHPVHRARAHAASSQQPRAASAVLASVAATAGTSLPDAAGGGTGRPPAKSARGNSTGAHSNALNNGTGHKRGLLGTQPGRSNKARGHRGSNRNDQTSGNSREVGDPSRGTAYGHAKTPASTARPSPKTDTSQPGRGLIHAPLR